MPGSSDPYVTYEKIRTMPQSKAVATVDTSLAPVSDAPVLYEDAQTRKAGTGQKSLDLIYAILQNWTRITETERVVTTLWIAHTWFNDGQEKPRLVFGATPRWLAIAPPSHGKSRVMEVMR